MSFQVYNTATRRVEAFEPIEEGRVRMYHCGPTVYSSPHIGNFRSFLTADLLRRHLEKRGYAVEQIMNITDVGHLTEDDIGDDGEDRMIIAARREKLDPWQIARKYEDEFHEASETLRFVKAHAYPRATEHIAEMIEIIEKLVDKGLAYEVNGNVYFEIDRFPRFGELAGKKIDELEEGARVDVVSEKRNPRDFALWKTDDKHLMQWDSPWGRGFPGWHIECSAMSRKYLGDQFDLHTGGEDNLFPHHECEVAQSEGFSDKIPFVRFWMHTRHLLVDEKKMSKSLGNFFTIADLLEEGWSGLEIRLALMRVHYRMPMNFTRDSLEESRKMLQRVGECRARLVRIAEGIDAEGQDDVAGILATRREEFGAALDDDLNIAKALAALSQLVTELNSATPSKAAAAAARELFVELDEWSGCVGEEPKVERSSSGVIWAAEPDDPRKDEISALAAERQAARAAKDWAKSDEARDAIQDAGYRVVDTPEGPRVELL